MSKPQPTQRISIVGYGRFGKVLHRLLKDDFLITIYKRSPITDRSEFGQHTLVAQTVKEIYDSTVIFFAVPIESFEHVIAQHKKYFRDDHLLIDVLSVKLHPAKVFAKYLRGSKTQALLTHPMFGPDSSQSGFENLPIILDQFKTDQKNYAFWKAYFRSKKLHVVELSAKAHDKLAANSQGLTHFLGRLLVSFGAQTTAIDSLGMKKLLEVKEQTCNDTWQLFTNLQHYNPYTLQMRQKLSEKFERLSEQLLPKKRHSDGLVLGIQGGRGSFNEEAALHFIKQHRVKNCTLRFFHTTADVFKALQAGKIDRGQFAIHNSVGGMVGESIEAMAKYRFNITDQFSIKIAHTLMTRDDADFSQITEIITHPQVLTQCRKNLQKKYPQLTLSSGEGKFIDHALVAKSLAEKKLAKNIATIGSRKLAQLYNLKVVEENLQDSDENETTFLQVERS